MALNKPIVWLIFDRRRQAERVFREIARQRPRHLLVVGDGPRPDDPESARRVEETRDLLNAIDWECDLRVNFAETNLGCKQRVYSGLTWAFKQFESLIVLEDDCLPHPDFFRFCECLLDRYHNEPGVWAISGDNFQAGNSRSASSYYFSRYPHCWGWASWRRSWRQLDLQLRAWPGLGRKWLLKKFRREGTESEKIAKAAADYWGQIFDAQFAEQTDSWAYPWTFSAFLQEGLTALPDRNLVSNIGFDDAATHTSSAEHPLANLPVSALGEIQHPGELIRHVAADDFTFQQVFTGDSRTNEPPPKKRPFGLATRFRNLVRRQPPSKQHV